LDVVFFRVQGGNFGDDLNEWLWDELLPGFRAWPSQAALVGVGTILKRGFLPEGRLKLVVGSGVGYGMAPDVHANPAEWDIRCVRGPRTAAKLGLPPEYGVVDPAVMLPDLAEFANAPRTGETLFIPHHASLKNFDWERICAGTGIVPVSPTSDAKAIIGRIAGAERVIAESMHAAIIADAFGTPWRGVAVSRSFNEFKWGDWAESLGVELRVRRFFPMLRRLQDIRAKLKPRRSAGPGNGSADGHSERLAARIGPLLALLARRTLKEVARGPFVLSDRQILAQRKRRLQEILAQIRSDHGG